MASEGVDPPVERDVGEAARLALSRSCDDGRGTWLGRLQMTAMRGVWRGRAQHWARLHWLCVALFALVAAPLSATAQNAPGVFTVATVPVDATAASAMAARDAARIDGQRRAFGILMARLTLAADRGRVPRVSDTALTDLVRDF